MEEMIILRMMMKRERHLNLKGLVKTAEANIVQVVIRKVAKLIQKLKMITMTRKIVMRMMMEKVRMK